MGANERINIAVIGIRGRDTSHINAWCKLRDNHNVRLTTLCDTDEQFFEPRSKMVIDKGGDKPLAEWDMRKVLDDKEIHAVSFATPNHWHAFGTIWACQAGKYVFKKPAMHNVWEGRKMIEADRPAILYSLQASRGPTLIYNGLQDSVISIPRLGTYSFCNDLHKRTTELRGSSKDIFEYCFIEGSHRPYFVSKPVALWLEKNLNFPLWTVDDILAMPVTHISKWAKINRIEMYPGYSSETREGGTMALGTGIPAPSRKELSVLQKKDGRKRRIN
jgi:hypothetical protein